MLKLISIILVRCCAWLGGRKSDRHKMKISYACLRQEPYQSYKHHNVLNFKIFVLTPQTQELKEFNPWQRSKSISWCRNCWWCCSLRWALYFLHQYYMLGSSFAQLVVCYQSIEWIRSGFLKIFAAKRNVFEPCSEMYGSELNRTILLILSLRPAVWLQSTI